MAIWTDRIDIDVAAETCFERLTNLDTCDQWILQVKRIEKTVEGPLKIGDSWIETRQERSREHRMVITVFEQHGPADGNAPYIHAAGAAVMGGRSFYRFVVTPIDEQRCEVRLDAAIEVQGWFRNQFARLIVRMIQKSEKNLLPRLKAFCELPVEAV